MRLRPRSVLRTERLPVLHAANYQWRDIRGGKGEGPHDMAMAIIQRCAGTDAMDVLAEADLDIIAGPSPDMMGVTVDERGERSDYMKVLSIRT